MPGRRRRVPAALKQELSDAATCAPIKQDATTPGLWNPLLYFDTVKQDGELGNIQPLTNFYDAARRGALPAVTWIAPTDKVSEHAPAKISTASNTSPGSSTPS